MSTLFVDTVNEKTTGNGVIIPGHVIQVQSVPCGSNGNDITITSGNTWTDIPEATITFTPKLSTSKLLIETYQHGYLGNNVSSTSWCSCNLRLLADSSNISDSDANTTDYYMGTYGGDNSREMAYAHESAYHSPNSSSAVTYKVQANFRHGSGGSASLILNRYGRGMLKIMEIAQ